MRNSNIPALVIVIGHTTPQSNYFLFMLDLLGGVWSLVDLIHPKYKETPLYSAVAGKCNLQNKSDWAECPFCIM